MLVVFLGVLQGIASEEGKKGGSCSRSHSLPPFSSQRRMNPRVANGGDAWRRRVITIPVSRNLLALFPRVFFFNVQTLVCIFRLLLFDLFWYFVTWKWGCVWVYYTKKGCVCFYFLLCMFLNYKIKKIKKKLMFWFAHSQGLQSYT